VTAMPSAARMGTMTIMGRLYRQVWPQTIELLVIRDRMQRMACNSRVASLA
jgi:hypothetical protein